MKTHAEKTQNLSPKAPQKNHGALQNDGESAAQLVDNRPEALAQLKLQANVNLSPQVQQFKASQEIANGFTAQRKGNTTNPSAESAAPAAKKNNATGLPDQLKAGVEQLSGFAMDDVKVHYNSDKPADLQAHAFAQGTDIHLAPGQEEHLPHEAWHVAQQMQGRVQATKQLKGKVNVNDDQGLETEADVMGLKAMQLGQQNQASAKQLKTNGSETPVAQRLAIRYGNSAPIPQDTQSIAEAQDVDRGTKIAAQEISAISEDVYDNMADGEKIYIVAHGRAPIGSEPAVLQEGDGRVLSGAQVASVIATMKAALAKRKKAMGEVKIEACMSSLSRKTEGGTFGETFVTAKPSLLQDIQKSLRTQYEVSDIIVKGNPGFSTGNDFVKGGVGNLSPTNTELGLLASIIETLYDVEADDWNSTANQALKKDGLNIIRKFTPELNDFHKNSQVKELISGSSADVAKAYLASKDKPDGGDVINICTFLNGYIRQSI